MMEDRSRWVMQSEEGRGGEGSDEWIEWWMEQGRGEERNGVACFLGNANEH